MLLSYSGAVLFLLAVVSAQHLPEHLHAEVVKGSEKFREILGRNVLFLTESSLQRGISAVTAAFAINGTQERAIVSLLAAGQLDEITRLTNILRETNASHCVSTSLTQATDTINNSGAVFENCVSIYVPEPQEIVDLLIALKLSFRTRFIEEGPTTIRNCAWDNFDSVPAVVECVNRFLEDFSYSGSNIESILRGVDLPLQQALMITSTCTETSRRNAIRALNDILYYIRLCTEDSGVSIDVAYYNGYWVPLYASELLTYREIKDLEGRINNTSARIAVLIDFLTLVYEEANRVTSCYIDGIIQKNFHNEISLIKNATLTKGLTCEEKACVNKANRDMNAAFNQGESTWLPCASDLAEQIADELCVIRGVLHVNFTETIRSDGFAAFMACVTQNNLNATAANECIRNASASLSDYLISFDPQVEPKEQIANNLSDALRDCRTTFLTNTEAKLKAIINTLKACVPKLGIQYST